MPMQRIKNAVAANGSYTDSNGKECTNWVKCGGLLKKDDGSLVLKLDAMPVGGDFEGWINFFDIEDTTNVQTGRRSNGQSAAPAPVADDLDDDIPF